MHISWLNVPVPDADVAVHDVQLIELTLVARDAHPNPIKVGRTSTTPASLLQDSTPGNETASVVVVGGTVVVGLVDVVEALATE
jgi:hypothetical protein